MTTIGCVIGLLLGMALSRLLRGMLYGISPFDPDTYMSVPVLTLLVAGLASIFPAVRATRVNSTQVLREE